jgi:hypothetical protein
MSITRGMTRQDKLRFEARQRKMLGKSKLDISMAAHGLLKDIDLEKIIGKAKADKLDRKLESAAAIADKYDGVNESYIKSSKQEDFDDWNDAGVIDTIKETLNG